MNNSAQARHTRRDMQQQGLKRSRKISQPLWRDRFDHAGRRDLVFVECACGVAQFRRRGGHIDARKRGASSAPRQYLRPRAIAVPLRCSADG
jgi:hypothetical protein